MEQLARDEAGNVWVVDASGAPVRLHTPAGGATRGQLLTPRPDPLAVSRDRRADNADQRAADAAARAANNDAARIGLERSRLALDERKAKDKLDTTGQSAKTRADAIAAYTNAGALDQRIAEMERLFEAGPGATKGVAGLRDYLPSSSNAQFDTAGDAVKAYVKSALGFTGGEGNTATEIQLNYGPYVPHAGDRDDVIRGKIDRLKSLAASARERSVAVLGGAPDANGNITPVQANGQAPAALPATTATQMTRNVADPAGSALIDQAVRSGRSLEQVNAGLTAMGLPTANSDQYRAAQRHFKQTGGVYKGERVNYGDAQRQVPTTARERLSGSATGAAAGHFFNSALAGLPSMAMGNQGALDLQAAANPGAALLGDVAGGVLGSAGAEIGAGAGLTRLGANAARGAAWAPRIGDAAYGALTGASANPDDPLTGGTVGALAGTGGGMFGRAAGRTIGRGLRGVVNNDAQYLRAAGVPLTVGQAVGGVAKQIEDAATSLPGAGVVVNNTRREGIRGFNRRAFNEAAEPLAQQTTPLNVQIGATGPDGIEALRMARQTGYSGAVNGRAATIDPQYQQDYARALTMARAIPNTGDAVATEIDAAVPEYFAGNVINGPNGQAAIRELRGIRQARRTDPLGNRTGNAVREAEQALTGLFDRQAPGFTNDLARANQTQTNLKVLEAAVSAAKNQEDNLFTPAQLNTASVQSANRLTGGGATTARPMYRLGQAGQAVLPSRLPDSGTPLRSALIGTGAVAGIGGGSGYASGDAGTGVGAAGGTLALGALLAGGASRPAQAAAVRLLMDRPDALVRIGNQVYDRAALAGMFGAGGSSLLTRP